MKLITSNPYKIAACQNAGITVVETIKSLPAVNEYNHNFSKVKMEKTIIISDKNYRCHSIGIRACYKITLSQHYNRLFFNKGIKYA